MDSVAIDDEWEGLPDAFSLADSVSHGDSTVAPKEYESVVEEDYESVETRDDEIENLKLGISAVVLVLALGASG